jgi:hypothetical protein
MADKIGAVYVEIGAVMSSFDKAMNEARLKALALDKNLSGVKESVASVDSVSARASATMLNYGTVIAGVATAIGAATIGWNAFIKPAMVAQEAASKFQTIFGAEGQEGVEWADRMGEAMARSSRELRSMAADMMALISPMAGSRDAAIQMSEGLVQMAQDLSSFHNVDVAEAFTALRSGISGETEPMKRFGILLTDAALQEYALAHGISKRISQMTTAEKVQLRYNAMLAAMGAANGDAERTSGSLTNQLRALSGTMEDGAVAIGTKLIPGLTQLVRALADTARAQGPLDGILNSFVEEINVYVVAVANAVEEWNRFKAASSGNEQQSQFARITYEVLAWINPLTIAGRVLRLYNAQMDSKRAAEYADKHEQLKFATQTLIQRYGSLEEALRNSGDTGVRAYRALKNEMDRLSDGSVANRIRESVLSPFAALTQATARTQTQQTNTSAAAYRAWLQQAKAAREKYSQLIEESGASEAEMAVIQYRRERDELINSYNQRHIDQQTFNDSMVALDQQRAAKMAEIRQKEQQQTAAYAMTILSTVGGMVSQLGNLFSMYYSNKQAEVDNNLQVETDALDAKYAADQTRINSEITDSAAKAAALKALDEQYARDKKALEDKAAKDKAKLEREAAKKQKVISIFDTTLAIPHAAFQAYNAMVGIPIVGPSLAYAAAAAATALGLAKLKLIMDTPLPAAAEGIYAESPYIGGEAGPELAFPLSSERGRAAIALLAEGVVNAASGSARQAPREATVTESGTRETMIQNVIYLDGAVIHESVSRATFDGRLLVASRAVV